MDKEYVRLGRLPEDFQELLMKEFLPYSVGLVKVTFWWTERVGDELKLEGIS